MRQRLLLIAAITAGLWQTVAAQAPATPKTPDLVGLYPGMPAQAARVQLQKHSDSTQVLLMPTGYPYLSLNTNGKNPQQISAYLTTDANPTVWLIQQKQTFERDNPMSQQALMSALRDKYGHETATRPQAGWLYVYWIFDASGKLLAAADPALTHCDGSSYINYINALPHFLNDTQKACYHSFFGVVAALNRQGELLEAYDVQLVNLPYAYQVALAATNAGNRAAAQAGQEQLLRANQNKPSF